MNEETFKFLFLFSFFRRFFKWPLCVFSKDWCFCFDSKKMIWGFFQR